MITIPLPSDLTYFDLDVVLDNATYNLEFLFNFRSQSWLMNVNDSDGNPLATGFRVVVDFPLTKRLATAGLPPGVLQAYDTSGQHRDPLQNDLGSRVLLVYTSQAELAAGA